MSDIPIGSPPAPPGRHAAPGGWYPDPLDAGQERYWDGWQWTRSLRPGATPPGQYRQPAGQQPSSSQQPYPHQQPPAQQPYGQNSYGQNPYGQNPYGQNPYGQNPYGQNNPSGQNPYGQQQYPQAPGGYGPVVPAGTLLTADGVRVSGWWWRVLASLLDGLITTAVGGLIAAPIWIRFWQAFAAYFNEAMAAASAGESPPPQPATTDLISQTDSILLTAIGVAVSFVYTIVFLRWKSATPGKLVVGLRVVPVDQGRFEGRLAWSMVLIRSAVWVLPGLSQYIVLVRLLDALWPLWHPKKQALHDLAAKTQVVKIS